MQTLGFLGPSGTHSEAAAMFLAEKMEGGAELRPYPDIFSVMQAAADGEVDVCVVPVENSLKNVKKKPTRKSARSIRIRSRWRNVVNT